MAPMKEELLWRNCVQLSEENLWSSFSISFPPKFSSENVIMCLGGQIRLQVWQLSVVVVQSILTHTCLLCEIWLLLFLNHFFILGAFFIVKCLLMWSCDFFVSESVGVLLCCTSLSLSFSSRVRNERFWLFKSK
jgi:hypothetical protein